MTDTERPDAGVPSPDEEEVLTGAVGLVVDVPEPPEPDPDDDPEPEDDEA